LRLHSAMTERSQSPNSKVNLNSLRLILQRVDATLLCPRPVGEGGGIKRSSASVVRLSDVAYIGSNSKTKGPRKTKLCTGVAQVTCDSHTDFKVKRSKVKVTGRGILWRPPSRTACYDKYCTWYCCSISASCATISRQVACCRQTYCWHQTTTATQKAKLMTCFSVQSVFYWNELW